MRPYSHYTYSIMRTSHIRDLKKSNSLKNHNFALHNRKYIYIHIKTTPRKRSTNYILKSYDARKRNDMYAIFT